MSKTAQFKVFCLEQYKKEHNMSGRDAMQLFKRFGVLDYIGSFFDVLHSYGGSYIAQDIDMFIQSRQENMQQ